MQGALALLAELAVAVLGFSGVVAALGQRSSGEWSDLDRLRFRSMIRLALLVLVLSLLPLPFDSAGLGAAHVWGWSSGIGSLLCIFVIVPEFRSASLASIWSTPDVSKLATSYAIAASLTAPILLALNAGAILLERAVTPYLIATLLLFGASISFFLRILEAAISRKGGSAA
jgi:hypothetical protein